MSANVEFNITANDDASSIFSEVSTNASTCFTNVTTSVGEAADNVQISSAKVNTAMGSQSSIYQQALDQQDDINESYDASTAAVDTNTNSTTKNALAVGAAASGAVSLVGGIYGIESAQTALSKVHVTVERDTNSVTSAQLAYNQAVAEYGGNSQQAQLAQAKLTVAQNALQVAQQRVSDTQNSVNSSYMSFGTSVIPATISMFTGLSTIMTAMPGISSAMSGGIGGLSTAFDGLDTSLIVVVAVVAIGMAIYEAYQHCKPFRDAVNEIGSVLEGAFKTAVTDIYNALDTVWNDVLKPLGEFIASTFIGYWNSLETAFNTVKNVLSDLWHDVLVPVANFFNGAFTDALNIVMTPINVFKTALNDINNIGKTLEGGLNALTGVLKVMCFAHAGPAAEEFNKQLQSGVELSGQLTNKLDPLKSGLLGVAGSTASGSGTASSQSQTQNQQDLINETKNLTFIMTKLTNIVQRGGSANQDAQALQRRM